MRFDEEAGEKSLKHYVVMSDRLARSPDFETKRAAEAQN